MLALTSLFFVVTGLQFWVSDYLRIVLGVSQSMVSISFALVCITAPLFGVLFGGKLVDSYGGYTSKYAIKICFIFAVATSLTALPIPYFTN
jgi:hypothetical protein